MTNRTYPITVMPRPSGVALDAMPYAEHFLRDLLDLLAEHPTLMDDLVDLIDNPRANDRHTTDKPSRDDQFITNVLASLPDQAKEIRVHGPALSRLARMLTAIANQQAGTPVTNLPQPRQGGAAA